MKNISLSLLAAFSISTFALAAPAHAQVPPSVMKPYKAYDAAMQSSNYKTALKEGRAAWKAAEKEMGDSKTTGDLAFNYGFLEKAQGSKKNAAKPLARAADLASTPTIRVEREVELVSILDALGDYNAAKKRTTEALNYAEANGMGRSIFAGELMVFEINECNRRASRAAKKNMRGGRLGSRVKVKSAPEEYLGRIQAQCGERGEQALAIFKANASEASPDYVAAAANAVGYAKERNGDWAGAAMAYQDSREAIETKLGRGNPLVAHTIGRWVNARSRLEHNGKLDSAKQAGLKDAWPYVQESPKVQASKRVKAELGTETLNTQRLSGYTILVTDVNDAGQTTNIRVLNSWPKGGYDGVSKAALTQWQYPAKTAGEPAGFRKDIAVPFTFIVYDRDNQDTY